MSNRTMYMLFGQEMDYLSSILYELDQEVITRGYLMTTVQAV